MDENHIIDIIVVSHDEHLAFLMMNQTTIDSIITNNGTTGVTATSSATHTGNAIIDAVEKALQQAAIYP